MTDLLGAGAGGPPATNRRVIVWFRRDLRLADNPALVAALRMAPEVVRRRCHALRRPPRCFVHASPASVASMAPFLRKALAFKPLAPPVAPSPACSPSPPLQVPVYLWAPEEEGQFQPGRCSRWWLHKSLEALDRDLRVLGSRLLCFRAADSRAQLARVAAAVGAQAVLFNHLYDPISMVCWLRVGEGGRFCRPSCARDQ